MTYKIIVNGRTFSKEHFLSFVKDFKLIKLMHTKGEHSQFQWAWASLIFQQRNSYSKSTKNLKHNYALSAQTFIGFRRFWSSRKWIVKVFSTFSSSIFYGKHFPILPTTFIMNKVPLHCWTYTDAYRLDFRDDATDALLPPAWYIGCIFGGFSSGTFSGGGGVMGLFLSGGKACGGSKSLRFM